MLTSQQEASVKGEHELDVRFRPVDETLRDAVEWFRAHGYVKGAAPRDRSQAAPRSPQV
jgi:hypothetical protein